MIPYQTPDTADIAGVINAVSQVYNLLNISLFLAIVFVGFIIAFLGILIVKEVINYYI